MILILWNLLRPALWSGIWSTSINAPCVLGANVHLAVVRYRVLCMPTSELCSLLLKSYVFLLGFLLTACNLKN